MATFRVCVVVKLRFVLHSRYVSCNVTFRVALSLRYVSCCIVVTFRVALSLQLRFVLHCRCVSSCAPFCVVVTLRFVLHCHYVSFCVVVTFRVELPLRFLLAKGRKPGGRNETALLAVRENSQNLLFLSVAGWGGERIRTYRYRYGRETSQNCPEIVQKLVRNCREI